MNDKRYLAGLLACSIVESLPIAQQLGAEAMKAKAEAFAHATVPIIEAYQRQGLTVRQIADELNRRGLETFRQGQWHASTVVNVLKRGRG